ELPGLTIASLPDAPHTTAKFDLALVLEEEDGAITGGLEYATSLFDRDTVVRFAASLRDFLAAMAADDLHTIDRLPLAGVELRAVPAEWNATDREYPKTSCVHELFEAQAWRTPQATAVIDDERSLTYAELNAAANRLAHALRARGVEPGDRVAVVLPRSIDLVIAEIAVLKCGAAYVPIDPTFPADRIAFMVADCEARVVLDAIDATENAGDLALALHSEMAAYVMYTSGSTGQPKGVVVPHRAITRLVINNGFAEINENDRVAFAANPAFDATTLEVWAPLLNGGTIVVIDHDTLLDPRRFAAALVRHEVSILWLTVGLFNQYVEELDFGRLRYLIVGGDALDPRTIAQVLRSNPPQHLLNGYGPTETTTFATTHHITHVADGARSIPLGRPIGNTKIHILDGEIHISGDGLAL